MGNVQPFNDGHQTLVAIKFEHLILFEINLNCQYHVKMDILIIAGTFFCVYTKWFISRFFIMFQKREVIRYLRLQNVYIFIVISRKKNDIITLCLCKDFLKIVTMQTLNKLRHTILR